MFKNMVFCLLLMMAAASPAAIEAKPKSNLVVLSVGVNYQAIQEKREDVYAKEAMHLENGLEGACDSMYSLKKKSLHSEKATRQACLDGMKWVADTAVEGDLAIVYIGAHGGGGEKGNYEFYPTHDTIVTSKEIMAYLRHVKSHLFVIIDSCHAGAILVDWKNPEPNLSILAACKADQAASVWKLVNPFVAALTDADYNKDKTIDVSEVEQYVIKNIDSKKQNPIALPGRSKIKICETDKRYLLPFEHDDF